MIMILVLGFIDRNVFIDLNFFILNLKTIFLMAQKLS